jgi:acyl-CoA thioester hydrolase
VSAQALPTAGATGAPVEVWRGCANAWECDHVGHLNTRYYVARVEQALAGLARRLALTDANDSAGAHQLFVKSQHMRFLREARAGAALHATAQVLTWGRDEAVVLFLLHHSSSGQVAATFRLAIDYVERSSGRPEPWPEQATRAASALLCEAPSEAKPRSISLDDVDVTASLERARELGMRTTGVGTITSDACDAHGNWRLSSFMGRVADSIPHLRNGEWREVLSRSMPGGPLRVGSALIEFQTVHVRWPRVGDGCEVRSAFAGCTERVTHSSHWLLDPETGAPWAAVRTVGIALDLDARRSIALTAEAQAAYRAASVPDLAL